MQSVVGKCTARGEMRYIDSEEGAHGEGGGGDRTLLDGIGN